MSMAKDGGAIDIEHDARVFGSKAGHFSLTAYPSSSPPTLDCLASATTPKPCLLGDAGSIGVDTPSAYLPKRTAGALGAFPPALGWTDADALDARLLRHRELAPNDVVEILDPTSTAELVVSGIPIAAFSAVARAPLPSSEHAMSTAHGRSDTDEASPPAPAGITISRNSRLRPAPGSRTRHSAVTGIGLVTPFEKSPRSSARAPQDEPLADEQAPAPDKEDRRAKSAQSGEGVQRVNSGSGREGRRRAEGEDRESCASAGKALGAARSQM
ncbi:hypothetical protein DFH11DRAFT_1881026 [Phellopilus nigrolimitatus]|nr:hypothetical protein DFH11DRAFT_1881026 [Phellopilus nigrolimitatus]